MWRVARNFPQNPVANQVIEGDFLPVNSVRKTPQNRRASRQPGSWSVVLIDGSAIRKKSRKDYEKVLREIDKAKAEAARFHAQDRPAFQRWFNSSFGGLLTEIRELQERLATVQNLVNEVQQEFYFGRHRTIHKAFEKVKHRRENPEEYEAARQQFEQEQQEARERSRSDFADILGMFEEEFWERLGVNPLGGDDESEAAPPAARRLKDLYRTLARRLHPDVLKEPSAQESEWWHQTQSAYDAGNVQQLEMILTLLEIQERGTVNTSVSILQQLTAQFKNSLKALRREISRHRRDLAWNFSRLTDLTIVFQKTRSMLEQERQQIAWLVQKYETQLRHWESGAAPAKRVRAVRANWRDEEWF